MAIHLQCPRCMHEQKIDDDKAGKEVPCKICHHLFTPGKTLEKTSGKPVSPEKKTSPQGVKAGLPSGPSGKKASTEIEDVDARPRKKARDRDEKRSTPRIRKEGGESGVLLYVLLAGGGFLLVALLCGGGFGAYFLFDSGPAKGEPMAQNINVPAPLPPQEENNPNHNPPPIQIPNPGPGPGPVNPPPPVPVAPLPPPAERLDPANPKQIDRVLEMLKGQVQDRVEAFAWLKDANPNHPRRAEVAPLLDGMVVAYLKGPPAGNDELFAAYFRWAGKENADTLLRLVETTNRSPANDRYRLDAVRLLGKLKDARVATLMAKKLENFFERGDATTALIEMGPIAEAEVLPYYNHPDRGIRDSARKVVQAYNTRSDLILDQCLADLKSPDGNRRGGALEGIAASQPDAKRKAEISKALNVMIENEGSLRNRDLVAALEKYGTSENATKLIQILEENRLGSHETIRALGKLRDPNGTKAIARQVGNFFNGGEAKKVLKECGPMAEPAVIDALVKTMDRGVRTECARFLGEIGTRKVSLPVLQNVAIRFQQDRQLVLTIQQAAVAINARRK